jgi:hypothetical protein
MPTNLQVPKALRKRSSSSLTGESNKRPCHCDGDQAEDELQPEMVFGVNLDLILALDQSRRVGSAAMFLFRLLWRKWVLLFCAKDQLKGLEIEEEFRLTVKELAIIADRYRFYTGDQNATAVEELTQILVSLFLPYE